MRTLLAGEFTTATAGDTAVDIYGKLEVQNGSGTWIDVAVAYGAGCITQATWGETIDTPVAQAAFMIVQQIGGVSNSGAPLMSASLLNRLDDGVTYAPFFEIGRLVRFSTATMPIGVALDTGEYRPGFWGRIDDVSSADALTMLGPITLTCSDLGGWLMDTQIETDAVEYGTTPVGTALETVVQNILNANIPAGEPAVTLVKESASNFAVTAWKQGQTKLLDALTTIVLDSTGEDLRYRFDASHVSQLMWFNPDRSRVTVDATFAPGQYLLTTLERALANIRNAGRMLYPGGAVTSAAPGSSAAYRRRFFQLAASPMLTTQAQTQAVLDVIVSDLSFAPATATATCPFFWFAQLYDRYTFQANDRQYDSDQTLAVVGYQHTIVNGYGSTALTLAGQVIGAYAAWLKRIGIGGPATADLTPKPTIGPVVAEGTARGGAGEGMVHIPLVFDANTFEIRIYTSEQAAAGVATPATDNAATSVILRRQEGIIEGADTWATMWDIATTVNFYRRVLIIAVGPTAVQADPVSIEIQAVDTGTGPTGGPTGLAVVMSTSGVLAVATLNWTCADAAAETRIERNGCVVAIVAPTIATFVDDGLTPSVDYVYTVDHYRNGQTSGAPSTGVVPSDAPTLVASDWSGDGTFTGASPCGSVERGIRVVMLQVTNPDPLATTAVYMNADATDTGVFTLITTLAAGLSVRQYVDPTKSGLTRWFYLVSRRAGYSDSAQSAHASATFP